MIMQLTHFLSQLLGLYLIIVSVSMLTQKQATMGIITSVIENPPMLFILEILGVLGGLAIVLWHNVWSSGLLPFLVTLVGWVTLVRSTIFLFLSPQVMLKVFKAIRCEQNYYAFVGISLLIGVYLTYAGFAG